MCVCVSVRVRACVRVWVGASDKRAYSYVLVSAPGFYEMGRHK